MAFRELRQAGAKQAEAGTTVEQIQDLISGAIMLSGRIDAWARSSEFFTSLDRLAEICLRPTEAQQDYLRRHASNMSYDLGEMLNYQQEYFSDNPAAKQKIFELMELLRTFYTSESATIGAIPGALPAELVMPSVPTPVLTQVTTQFGDFEYTPNPEWLGLFLDGSHLSQNSQLAAEAGYYDLIGDRGMAAQKGREWMEDTVANINATLELTGEDALTVDKFLSGDWGISSSTIAYRFGTTDKDHVLHLLDLMNQGRILEALRDANPNTTFAYTLADFVAGTLKNLELRVSRFAITADVTYNIWESDYLFLNVRAIAEMVLSQRYVVNATELEDGRWRVDLEGKEIEARAGGGLGAEFGVYLNNPNRYISIAGMAEWRADIQDFVGTFTAKYRDTSGRLFGLPTAGYLHTELLGSIDTDGRVHASGTLEFTPINNNDYLLGFSMGAAYGTNISDSSQRWLASLGRRDYWTFMPGASFEMRNIGESGWEQITSVSTEMNELIGRVENGLNRPDWLISELRAINDSLARVLHDEDLDQVRQDLRLVAGRLQEEISGREEPGELGTFREEIESMMGRLEDISVSPGLERFAMGVHCLFDTETFEGMMGAVTFSGQAWSVALQAAWRRLRLLPDMGELIVGEDGRIDTGTFGLEVKWK